MTPGEQIRVVRSQVDLLDYRAADPQTGHMKRVSTWVWEAKSAVEEALAGIVAQLGAGTHLRPNEQTVRHLLEDDWVPGLNVAVAGGRYKQSKAGSHRLHARYHSTRTSNSWARSPA